MEFRHPFARTSCRVAICLCVVTSAFPGRNALASGDSQAPETVRRTGLTRIHPVTYVSAEWNDGDSFVVRFPDGKEHTLRLYGVDCIEDKSSTDTDARRIRDQRRHFGIAQLETAESVALALQYGKAATERTREILAEPFTVYTAFADGRGDPRFPRVLAFVTTSEGRDLSAQLVAEGLARAFGIARQAPDGASQDEFRQRLLDLEMVAASRGTGVWSKTDWDSLPEQRRIQREELEELAITRGAGRADVATLRINPNTAARRELEELPGIGEALALRIIEARSSGLYRSPEDLLRVNGIGPATLERIQPGLVFD